MTSFVNPQLAAGEPALHAFIVGVGGYPNLVGGAGEKAQTWGGLGQLSSAPLSALEVASFLARELAVPAASGRPACAVGSIELLVSPPGGTARFRDPWRGDAEVEVERATVAAVRAAFEIWRRRVDAREEDTALFFFSGHGVERNQWHGLLLEGFDATKAEPFEDVINLGGFVSGMDGCRARKQCFLVDACRSTPTELRNLDMRSDPGVRLIAAQYDLPIDELRDVALIRATGARQVAWGVADKPSRFTSALLRALRGAGCSRLEDRWEVRTDTLVSHLNTLLRYESEAKSIAVQNVRGPGDDSGGFVLHVPPRPLVPVVVACVPESDTARARFEIKRGGESVCARGVAAGSWEIDLVLDEYDVFATIEGPPRRKRILAHPTICAVRL